MGNKKYIKGFLEDIVLHLINEEGEMYGYEITQKVRELSQGAITITEGALYPILHKLEREAKLTVSYRKIAGRLRKYYRLTPEGGVRAATASIELTQFLAGLAGLFNLNPQKA
jgi:DNA-binding PadR family transcriptional regulator